MKTRTKVIVATAAAVLLGGVALAGVSQADGRYGGRHFGDHHGGYGMGGYMGRHHDEPYGRGYGYTGRHHDESYGRGYGYMGRHYEESYGRGYGRGMTGMFDAFDGNADGKLTQAEIDQARTERLTSFDTDGDGKLTLEEYQALWLDAMHSRIVDRFQDLDDNGDSVVTAEEFTAPYSAVVSRMDRNDDGQIGPEDMRRPGFGPYRERSDD